MTAPILDPNPELPGLISDGFFRVVFCDTLTSKAAPTVAELNAGLPLESQLTPNGLKTDISDEMVDTSRLSSTFSSERIGRSKPSIELTLVRLDEGIVGVVDAAYNTLVKRKLGYLVVRDNLPGDVAWGAGQKVRVYRVECGTRQNSQAAANEQQTFVLPMATPEAPDLYAVVAA